MRTKEEIEQAIHNINDNSELRASYKEDTIAVLRWTLGEEKFDGLK